MPNEKRERVTEWRITRPIFRGNVKVFTARVWVEASGEHGGLAEGAAIAAVDMALGYLYRRYDGALADDVCAAILDRVPAANSVEVCDEDGNGVAMHRDWP